MNRMPQPTVEENLAVDDLAGSDLAVDDLALFGDEVAFFSCFDTSGADFVDDVFVEDVFVEDESSGDPFPSAYAGLLDQFLDDVSQQEAALAMQAARRARAVEQARAWAVVSDEFVLPGARLSVAERENWVMRVFVSELATRLRLPEPSAARLIAESRMLVRELPGTLDALSAATISYRHAQVIIDQAGTLPPPVRAAFEQAVIPDAARLPVTGFRRRAIRTRELLHPDSIADRTRAAAADRRFVFEADTDGMGWLHHRLPAAQALGVFNRVTAIAKTLQGENESRTLAQLRCDVAADLLLDGETVTDAAGDANPTAADSPTVSAGSGTGGGTRKKPRRGIRATVFVTVPVLTLLGKKRYKPPKDLQTWLQFRDETCRFPGCGRAAIGADIDHTLDWAGFGRTEAINLACLCKPHHLMKHTTSWQVTQRGNGILDWISPTRRIHTTRPTIDLPGTSLPSASLPGASLPGASLPSASLPGASLPSASLPGTSLPGTNPPAKGSPPPDELPDAPPF